MKTIPDKAIELILESEGVDQPSRWPGGGSGITLGYGCDIGADPESLKFWQGVLESAQIDVLKQALGKTGRRAAEIASRFAGIKVTRAQALGVFSKHTLPTEIQRTVNAFPGVEFMPDGVLGAMVSLVFNRGTDITDDPGSTRRREMRIIHEILAEFGTFEPALRKAVRVEYSNKIARQIRMMKRLWEGQGLDGLITRRENEAKLVESTL